MRILEIIQLRSAAKPKELLSEQIKKSVEAVGEQTEVVTIFRRGDLETDLAIHIHHPDVPRGDPSGLGLRLASSLRAYGLVDHTVWENLV